MIIIQFFYYRQQNRMKIMELSDPHFNQPNQKSFKLLHFIFNKNLQSFQKTHKKVITQLQEPIKIRIKKEQQTFVQNNVKKIFQQNLNKLLKENLQRNEHVLNTLNSFSFLSPQRKAINQKNIQATFQSIQNQQKRSKQSFIESKARSKTVVNNSNKHQIFLNTVSDFKTQKHRRNTSDISIVKAYHDQGDQKNTFLKKNYQYQHLKHRNRNYSYHSQADQNKKQRKDMFSENIFDDETFSSNRTEKPNKQNLTIAKDPYFQAFRPFYGLNTKDIFVKKPIHPINNPSQHMAINELKLNYNSKTTMKRKFLIKKSNIQQYTTNYCDINPFNQMKNDQQMKQIMNQKILKISSDLAIKTLEPQGYRGKSRIRYRSLNEAK